MNIFLAIFYILPSILYPAYGKEAVSPWTKLPSDCGRTRFSNVKTRIINGEGAALGQFPYLARLGMTFPIIGIWFYCGGSLINRYYVISAAHCEERGDVVRLGENYADQDKDCDETGTCAPPPQDIKIKRYVFADYCRESHVNDMMLVELSTPAEFNEFVQPICLPRNSPELFNITDTRLTVAGFGQTNGSEPTSEAHHLMYVRVPTMDQKECIKEFKGIDEHSTFCINSTDKGHNACRGDSGGPASRMVMVDGVRRHYLFGITSLGKPNCVVGAVYTNILYYINDILFLIKKF